MLRELSKFAARKFALIATTADPVTYGYKPSEAEAALRQIEAEQIQRHYFDDALLTAKRFPNAPGVSGGDL